MHTPHKPWKKHQVAIYPSVHQRPPSSTMLLKIPPYFNSINQETGKGFFIVKKLILWLFIWKKPSEGTVIFLKATASVDWHKIVSHPTLLPYALILFYVYYKNSSLSLKMFPEIKLTEIFIGQAELLSIKFEWDKKKLRIVAGFFFFFFSSWLLSLFCFIFLANVLTFPSGQSTY